MGEECEKCELHSKHLIQEHLDEQVVEEVPGPEHERRKMNVKGLMVVKLVTILEYI